jgi:serine/threonine protein kinase
MAPPSDRLPGPIAGRYEVEARIGTGGMGVVYRARDTRLNRLVAIKAIHDHRVTEGGGRLRLRDEALAAASLDHPYICKVYELVEDTSNLFLVMEFVEGETLATVLRRGPMPLGRVLAIGSEVAEGLANAHRRGLVHRDIKPSNVMVTPDGHVKLLDFGLAQPDVITPPAARTRTSPSGASDYAGTPQYMAPEQAMGAPVTARADLFSLGVILFEATTGRLPFAGTSGYDYVRHLLSDDPRSMDRLAPDIPIDLVRLVHRCLEKTPADRPESADAVLAGLRQVAAGLTSSGRPLQTAREARVRARARAIAGAAGVAVVATLAWLLWPSPPPIDVLDRSRPFVTRDALESGSRVSPGGDWVSFFSSDGDRDRLFVQPATGGDAIAVSLADGRPQSHVWAPDGSEIACLIDQGDDQAIHIVPPFGGQARRRISIPPQRQYVELVRWVGRAIYLRIGSTLGRLNLDSEAIEEVSARWSLAGTLRSADVSPDGRSVVYALSADQQEDLWISDVDGGRARPLTRDGFFERSPIFRGADAVVYQSNRGGPIGLWELSLSTGRSRPLTSGLGFDTPGGSSLDGRVLSYARETSQATLWAWQAGSAGRQVTTDALGDFAPSLTADRRTIAFQRSQPSPTAGHSLLDAALFVGRLDARGQPGDLRPVADGFAPMLSPDGTRLAYLQRGTAAQTMAIRMRHLKTDERVTVSEAAPLPVLSAFPPLDWAEQNMTWSVSGDALFFVERGAPEVIRRFEAATGRIATVLEGPPDGSIRDLYVAPDGSRLGYRVRVQGRDLVRAVHLDSGVDEELGILTGTSPARLFGRGWLAGGRVYVLLRPGESHPDRSADVEVLAAEAGGPVRRIGSVARAFVTSARLDASTSSLFVTRADEGVHNAYTYALDTARLDALTDNTLVGVTFSGLTPAGPRLMLAVRDQRRQDIWLSERDTAR